MAYRIEIKPAAQRQIKKLPPSIQNKIFQALEELKSEPHPATVKKMIGEANAYRVRARMPTSFSEHLTTLRTNY